MKEIWKPISGFEGYEVSILGRVRSFKKRGVGGWAISKYPQRILSPSIFAGYELVNLRTNGKSCGYRIHQLVMQSFVGPCPDGMEICHNDGNKRNNHLNNLRYDTHTNNMQDIFTTEDGRLGHLCVGDVKQIRKMLSSRIDPASLADKFNLSMDAIWDIAHGETWKAVNGPRTSLRKTTATQFLEIRSKREHGVSLKKLSEEYGLCISSISRIARGERGNATIKLATRQGLV